MFEVSKIILMSISKRPASTIEIAIHDKKKLFLCYDGPEKSSDE